jgi:hypothetical protein
MVDVDRLKGQSNNAHMNVIAHGFAQSAGNCSDWHSFYSSIFPLIYKVQQDTRKCADTAEVMSKQNSQSVRRSPTLSRAV